jgi:hypothetical protein
MSARLRLEKDCWASQQWHTVGDASARLRFQEHCWTSQQWHTVDDVSARLRLEEHCWTTLRAVPNQQSHPRSAE